MFEFAFCGVVVINRCFSFLLLNPVDDVPEHVRHLLLEPVDRQPMRENITSPNDPRSPTSDEEGKLLVVNVM